MTRVVSAGVVAVAVGALMSGWRVLTLDEAKQRWRDGEASSPSVRFAMAGASIDTLIATLRAASPAP
jgi:hypothetical protein